MDEMPYNQNANGSYSFREALDDYREFDCRYVQIQIQSEKCSTIMWLIAKPKT